MLNRHLRLRHLIKDNWHHKHHLRLDIGESVLRKPEFRSWEFSRAESLETWHSLSGLEACIQESGTLEFEYYHLQLGVIMIHLCTLCMFLVKVKVSYRV